MIRPNEGACTVRRPTCWHGRLRLSALAAALALSASPGQAETSGAGPAHPSLAQVDQRAFDIPAQPLAEALIQFGQQAGLQATADANLVENLRSAPVRGTMSWQQALRALLEGTGLTYRQHGSMVALEPLPDSDAGDGMMLGAITVEGRTETAYGPVDGYVAHRSATGTKTDTPIIETPRSISVVTRDQMEAQGVQSIGAALRYTAGVTSDTRGPVGRHDVIYSRGFGGFSVEYLDGMRLTTGLYAIPQLDPYDLERIEVLRGPASVLYGQNNPGGIVNLVTKRPTEEPYHEIQIQGGSNERKQGAFDLSGPIDDEGTLLYRVVGLARDSDTQVDHTEERRFSIAPSLLWRPTDDTSLLVQARYQREPEGGFFGFVPAQGTVLDNPNGHIPSSFYDGEPTFEEFDRELGSIGYLLEHRFDDTFTVRQNFRYMHIETDWARVASRGLQADLRTLNRQAVTDDESFDAVTLDNQLQAEFSTSVLEHTTLFGLDYQYSDADFMLGAGAAPTLDIVNPIYGQAVAEPPVIQSIDQTQHQIGLYAQDQIALGSWRLTLGGRHDWAGGDSLNRLSDTTTETSDSAFTGRAGLVYLFDNGLAPYISYSESFEPTTGSGFDGQPFEPTTGHQYEAGIKYQPTGFDGFFTVAGFQVTEQNVLTTDPEHPNFSIQTGEIRSRGVELEGKVSLAEGLNLTASYTYLDAEVTKSNGADLGKRPVSIPEHSASAWADYTFQDGALSGFGLGAGIRYVGPTYGNAANTIEVPDYALVDAAVSYDFGQLHNSLEGMHLAVNAANLFDKEHIASCSNAPSQCYYGLGRTVYATLTYRW